MGNFFQNDEHPEDFTNEEFTTEEVRNLSQAAEVEKERVVARARRTGRNVEKPNKPQRRHVTPAQHNARARQSLREHEVVWRPAATLEAPPFPPGMVGRWIRSKLGDKDDPKNLSRKFRTGWRPYFVREIPDGSDYEPPETYASPKGDVIAVGDLILCVMPAKLFEARKRYFKDLTQRQLSANRQKARSISDIRVEEKDAYTRGRRPQVQDDE
jgi:hypothetical protein